MRGFFVWLHRYVGLTLALFLIIEGATGSLMAFEADLTNLLDPTLVARRPSPQAQRLDLATLAERAEALVPQAKFSYFIRVSDEQVFVRMEARDDPASGKPFEIDHEMIALDPWTGDELGRYGVYKQGILANVMPFVEQLHYNLALGERGLWITFVIALLWTIDCFVGFYLTFPLKLEKFWTRWKPAWLIKWRGGFYRVNFDLHRAGGLWFWAMLFVFAWSSVQLTDGSGLYESVMGKLFGFQPYNEELTALHELPPRSETGPLKLDLRAAQTVGERLMAELAQREGFKIEKPIALSRFEESRQYNYSVRTDRRFPYDQNASVFFDADTGAFQATLQTNRGRAGNTISNWLRALHMVENPVDYLAYRIFVVVVGLLIVMLSATGVYVWWKKRKARVHASSRGAAVTAHSPQAVDASAKGA